MESKLFSTLIEHITYNIIEDYIFVIACACTTPSSHGLDTCWRTLKIERITRTLIQVVSPFNFVFQVWMLSQFRSLYTYSGLWVEIFNVLRDIQGYALDRQPTGQIFTYWRRLKQCLWLLLLWPMSKLTLSMLTK